MTEPAENPSTDARRQFASDASSAIARICLLPDPRPFYKRSWFGLGKEDPTDCIERQMQVKAKLNKIDPPAVDSTTHANILQRARLLADAGVKACQVRDFEYPGSGGRYYGYRGADRDCHTTQNKSEAENARKNYPQR